MGRCSEIWIPETFVDMGLNSPRISTGASGFISNISIWLDAPVRKTRMTDLGFLVFKEAVNPRLPMPKPNKPEKPT